MRAPQDAVYALVDACAEINQAAECSTWFSAMVAEQISRVTIDVNTLTVGELRQHIRQCAARVHVQGRPA